MNCLYLICRFLSVLVRVLRPGGARALAAENIVLRQQLLVIRQHRKRAPKLTVTDRVIFGFLAAFIPPKRFSKMAIILMPATLLRFHQALVKRKYRYLYSAKTKKKPGLKGSSQSVIDVILAMKQRNPRFGHRRIAMQIALAFGIEMDKDTVRRVLNKHFKGTPKKQGSSWLTLLAHMKDSLWSVDLFCCESIHLNTHWVMFVMDQFTRRLTGLAVHAGALDGIAVCCLFNTVLSKQSLPKHLSSDNDPLFTFHRWQANLRILEIQEIKTVPHVPLSYPFVERLIGTLRREYLDHVLFWTAHDLERKLSDFLAYYNMQRGHMSIAGQTPVQKCEEHPREKIVLLEHYRWQSHCRGLFQLPKAA